MNPIAALQSGVTHLPVDMEPSDAELDTIKEEAPLIEAELDLLGLEIAVLDRVPSELDAQRIRRAQNRV
ncbi:DUF6284 family protein, partial [Streptomyces bambusae]|uniref:DUF6284 family protein n=1 Tax=Streptomyces bambusae TaxID=1550616 RepID=UPI001D001A04